MRITLLALVLGLLSVAAGAAPKTVLKKFVILGGQTIEHQVAENGPTSAENESIRIEVTGFMTGDEQGKMRLTPTYGFTAKKPLTFTRVVVEEVTGKAPVLLVTDDHPVLSKDGYWKGNAASVPIEQSYLPWLFAPGDTWRVFRFTISTSEKGDFVMLQPSWHPFSSKAKILELFGRNQTAPAKVNLDRFMKSAGALMNGAKEVALLPVLERPTPAKAKVLLDALKYAKKKKVGVVIGSENATWLTELALEALREVKKDQFKGVTLFVIGPDADATPFKSLADNAGLTVRVGPLLD